MIQPTPSFVSWKALKKNMTMYNITHARVRTYTHRPNGSTSQKAVSVNCAIKSLKGMVDEIKLLWKSMTDAVHDRQASETSTTSNLLIHPPPSQTHTHTPNPLLLLLLPSPLLSHQPFILSGKISNQRRRLTGTALVYYWQTCMHTHTHTQS